MRIFSVLKILFGLLLFENLNYKIRLMAALIFIFFKLGIKYSFVNNLFLYDWLTSKYKFLAYFIPM